MGIDPAWGSSAFGIVVTQWVDEHIQVIHAEEYQRPDYNEMLKVVWKLLKKFNINIAANASLVSNNVAVVAISNVATAAIATIAKVLFFIILIDIVFH
jgi:hypothetical protein